jgi:hypothetical protein
MKKILISSLLVLFGFVATVSAQRSACVEYHLKKCKNQVESNYSVSDASRSALLLKGQTSEFRFLIYEGKDYRITICGDDLLGPNLQFQIVDWETNEVLYDNKDYNFVREFEFTVLMSRTVKLVVTVPSEDPNESNNSIGFQPKSTAMGCIGVLIEEMITPKKGF